MLRFLLRRLFTTIPTILLVTVAIFVVMRLNPAGPATAMLGDQATPEAVAALNQKLGLDQPLYIQYGRWLGGALQGDLGRSAFGNQPVTQLIAERIMPTVELGLLSMLLSLLIGLSAGIVAAIRHNSFVGIATTILAIMGISTPSFWLAIMLVLVFSIWLPWLPSLGYTSPLVDLGANLQQMVLPSITLGVVLAAVVTRMTRAAMLDAIFQDYVRTARAKGLSEQLVLWRHALANALIPIVTIVGLQLGAVLSGAIIIEQIFALPGTGQLLVTAIFARDFPVVQGVVAVIALVFIVLNLTVDLLYGVLDPRIRLG